jgi:CheY-like chemotaxis protein
MPELTLQILASPGGNQGKITVPDFPYTIGRRRDCNLHISDRCVTRLHCRLSLRDGQVWVEDLGSLNGTFVNEDRVEAPRPLSDDDRLRVAFIVFKVQLSATADELHVEKTETAARVGHGRQVLVVEDDLTMAESLALVLKDWGYEVNVAHNGEEALQAACDNPPDTVLLDIRLPGMDGFQVARRLREEAGLQDARMVAMTGSPEAAEGGRAEQSGVQEVLIKPVQPEALRAVIGPP